MGKIGPAKISETADGKIVAEYVDPHLPTDKDELEMRIGDAFISKFNTALPLGDCRILNARRQGTDDLDYRIESKIADYLELAEMTPLSELFGRDAKATGRLPVQKFAKWVHTRIILNKMSKYGVTADRTILLLYSIHPQFIISDDVIECLRGYCLRDGNRFPAILVFMTDGGTLGFIKKVTPWHGRIFPPGHFRDRVITQIEPENWCCHSRGGALARTVHKGGNSYICV